MLKYYKVLFLFSVALSIFSCTSYRFSKKVQRIDSVWKVSNHKEYILFIKENSLADKDPKLLTKIDSAIQTAKSKSRLDSFYAIPFHLYIVDNPDQIKPFIKKGRYQGVTYSISNTILQTHQMAGSTHEYYHLLTVKNWGESKKWIKEGAAVYSEVKYKNLPLHNYSNFVIKNNKVDNIKLLFRNITFKKVPAKYSYPLTGSMIQYITEKYGFEAFRKVWEEKSVKAIHKLLNEFLEEWKLYINSYPTYMFIERN